MDYQELSAYWLFQLRLTAMIFSTLSHPAIRKSLTFALFVTARRINLWFFWIFAVLSRLTSSIRLTMEHLTTVSNLISFVMLCGCRRLHGAMMDRHRRTTQNCRHVQFV